MKKYTVRRHGDIYKIYESSTKQYVAAYGEKDPADHLFVKLTAGCGFAGNTPSFITRTIPRNDQIASLFQHFFQISLYINDLADTISLDIGHGLCQDVHMMRYERENMGVYFDVA